MSAVSELEKEPARESAAAHARTIAQDCLFLALVVLLSLVLYVTRLGFYSDDWAFLSFLHLADDRSLPGLYQALYAGDEIIRQRPVQIGYLALLYALSGLHPTGYHLANAGVLVASAILFYLALRELRQTRLLSLTIALVYILLPHYSTDRFWLAAHQATLSIAFYFLSLYTDLRAARASPAGVWGWKSLSITSLILSGLAYEVTLPLFLLNPLLVWYADRQRKPAAGKRMVVSRTAALSAGNLAALALVIGFKALVTVRTNVTTNLITHLATIIAGALRVNFGIYGLGLPYVVWWIIFHNPQWPILALGGLTGLVVWFYFLPVTLQTDETASKKTWLVYIGAGLLFFALGYAVFIASDDVWFTSASSGNRVAIAAAIGVALTFTGLIGWTSAWLPAKAGRGIFCLCVAMLCTSGFLINNTLATFWISAYQQQEIIFNDMQQHVPALPAQSTVILDGVCLEQGGAYIFTGKRDLGYRLRMAYPGQNLWATAISNTPRIEAAGLSVLSFRDYVFFPYGEDLFVYNFSQKRLYPLTDEESARLYFQQSNFVPERDCPAGFAWGLNSR